MGSPDPAGRTPSPVTSPSPPSPPDALPLSASTHLLGLPHDAKGALAAAGEKWADTHKVTLRFKAIGAAPILRTQVYRISASHRFEFVVTFLRARLKCQPDQSLFCYVNSVFAPALDEGVGSLHRCFKTDDTLIVAYSMTPAFG